ncbi:MAG: hypothetical protein RQ748_13160, partial [Elusimicrobiales bacterium]|nr:hypothetical protein [Elusimicrobiales bacterium]
IMAIAARNKFLLHYAHLDLPSLLLWFPMIAGNLLLKTLRLKFHYLRGFTLFLGNIGEAAASRRKVPQVYTLRQAYARIHKMIRDAENKNSARQDP